MSTNDILATLAELRSARERMRALYLASTDDEAAAGLLAAITDISRSIGRLSAAAGCPAPSRFVLTAGYIPARG